MEEGGGSAFFVREGDALTLCTELQRNLSLPARAKDELQITLAVLLNGTTPCDCIYISQAAVDAHHVCPTCEQRVVCCCGPSIEILF
jgi:hypothetical protein